ncbi:bile acid:sodium symporter [Moraxella caviae]|uniref:Bile acid transporter n=1 Tax=Moraxella caviae TaxID=34060 RepID=A0A1T0A5W0_9GAMM|nr:bile acid:sodium symporter family protein [Moraxella caviae]OOR91060.1 bile acid:sodium symporter [Moraxella caviae]STZ14248.1 bile acid transporter [Moraxella caviae]VEW13127.1 bile acid transporter [Moraxella caviae]
MSIFATIGQQATKFTAAIIILAAIIGMINPMTFSWVAGTAQMLVLGVIMLGIGITLGTKDYKILAQRPLDILAGATIQYTVMPLLAIGIGRMLNLSDGLILGLVLVGSCPGGVSSNIMTYLARGDVAFSVGMTTVSTLLAPVMTPLWLMVLLGETVDMDAWGMFKFMLLVTLFPVLLGSFSNMAFGSKGWFEKIKDIMPAVAVLAFACIVGGVAAVHGHRFAESALVMVIAIALHNAGGYVLGFYAAQVVGMSTAKKRTVAIETGVQNAGLATGLSAKFFPANAESAIATAVAVVWHSVSGTILGNGFAWWDVKQGKGESNAAKKLS